MARPRYHIDMRLDPKPHLDVTWPRLLLLLLLLLSSAAFASGSGSGATARAASPEWQVLTKANYSSQIRIHPHVLLLVTMPWYGESRSLMTEIKQLVAANVQEFSHLKLMVVYRNLEKMLADVLGAADGIKFIYHQHSMPFKYHGKLRARVILSSVRYIMSLKREEVPFEVLRAEEDVEAFLESTDKSVLLLEFCGWSAKLSHNGRNGNYEITPSSKNHSENVDVVEETLTRESDGTLDLVRATKKVMEDEELTYGVEDQVTGSPWKDGFTVANRSISHQIENKDDENRISCTIEEFHQFKNFYAKFTTIAREYFLPPEKQRFGLITERSLLPFLDVGNVRTWLLMIHNSGCASCSVILKEEDDLRSLLRIDHHLTIKEIDVDKSNDKESFPASRPSIILFIDRLSDISKVRDESKLALRVLREYVQQHQLSYDAAGELHNGNTQIHSTKVRSVTNKVVSDPLIYQTRVNSLAPKIMKVKDNMAVMIVNDGESISYKSTAHEPSSLGSPLYDILTKLLQHRKPADSTKKTRINLIAKKGGFQLLSDDFEVQEEDPLPAQEWTAQSDCMSEDSVANSEGDINDDANLVSAAERKIREPTYIDDGYIPDTLVKTFAMYTDINNSDLIDSSDTNMVNEGNETELSDTRTDLWQIQEEGLYDKDNINDIGHKLQNEAKIVADAFDSLESNGRHGYFKHEKSESVNWQDEESLKLVDEAKNIEEDIDKDNFGNDDISPGKSTSKTTPHSTFSSSASLVTDDAADYAGHTTSSMLDDDAPFVGSFFFSDGGYGLLRTLTDGSKIPSLVILDPIRQKHYVFPEETEMSYSSLGNFLDNFLNQSLTPYYRSSSAVISSKEFPNPPFVNLDFREANSIPRVTTNTFCELVVGFKACEFKNEISFSNSENFTSAWKTDVLVLFSNSWCGFCQRTELVVREVYRAFKSFITLSNSQTMMDALQIKEKNGKAVANGLPSIYLMDCTSNDCYPFLELAGKDEFYPALLLFPAENKTAISYDGAMSVIDVIEFFGSHGSNSLYLEKHKGFLRKKRRSTPHDIPMAVLLHDSDRSSSHVDSPVSSRPDKRERVVVGSILTATEKLVNAIPFNNATVFIVLANPQEGFQGMIINKLISWDIFKDLDNNMEPLKQAPLFYGGPVRPHGYPLVSLSRKAVEGYVKVIEGVYYGNPAVTGLVIERIKSGDQSVDDLWFFLGYSGWGYVQLFDELNEGAWHLSEHPLKHLEWPRT